MIQLRHNGDEQQLEPERFPNVGAAIEAFTGGAGAEVSVLVRLCIDGLEIPEASWEQSRGRPTSGILCIEIESQPLQRVARRTLRQARDYAPAVCEALGRVVELFRSGESARASELYVLFLDSLSVWSFALESSAGSLSAPAATLVGLDAVLLPWLRELMEAHEGQDWVRVADLLEFEVQPILESWSARLVEAVEALPEGEN